MRDYAPVTADAALEHDARWIVRLAIAEDVGPSRDWTTDCLIDPELRGECLIVPRESGVCAGLVTLPWIIDEFAADLRVEPLSADGDPLVAGQPLVRLTGGARDLLTAERTMLNFLCRLCGVASLTRRYVDRIVDFPARLYDTRKTTPGWRRLEKYAVRAGGGHNHRTGLFDGFLIKDNHLALAAARPCSAGEATRRAIECRQTAAGGASPPPPEMVEIEVDSLEQLRDALAAGPDIVLLDNFTVDELREAVSIRDASRPAVELEASGNVTIETVGQIAATGVERISCGALTHQATWLDLGMDWSDSAAS